MNPTTMVVIMTLGTKKRDLLYPTSSIMCVAESIPTNAHIGLTKPTTNAIPDECQPV